MPIGVYLVKKWNAIVFTAPQVKSLMSQFILLRADVTANDAIDKALERQFHVIAPPTFYFLHRMDKN